MSKKEVMIVTGAGQISMAIARRVGYGKKIVMGDKNIENAKKTAAADFATTVTSIIHIFLKSHFLTDIPIPIHFFFFDIRK